MDGRVPQKLVKVSKMVDYKSYLGLHLINTLNPWQFALNFFCLDDNDSMSFHNKDFDFFLKSDISIKEYQ